MQHWLLNRGIRLTDFVQHSLVDGDRLVETVDGARTGVEQVSNRIKLPLAVDEQVRALRQVMTDQSVVVFAGTPLPRAVGIAEVNLHTHVVRQLGMARHILSLVVGQGLAHGLSNAAQVGRETLQHRGSRRIDQLDQHHQARTAFEQYTHSRAVARPLDEIALPVAGEFPVIGLGRAHMDAQQVGHLAPAVLAPPACHALGLCTAQTGEQLLAQLAFLHGIDAGVDGFVRDGAEGFIEPHKLQCACDLQGRPTLRQEVLNDTEKHGVAGQLGAFAAFEASALFKHTGCAGDVYARGIGRQRWSIRPRAKARQFAGDGRKRTAQRQSDLSCRAVARLHHHDRRTCFSRHFFVILADRGTSPAGC